MKDSFLTNSLFTDYWRATLAECFKLKRTSALLTAIVAPYVAVLLQFIIILSGGDRGYLGWSQLGGNVLMFWTGLLLPFLISLTAAFLADLENRHQQWKHLFALPVSRGALYAAKQTASILLLLLSHGLLTLGLWMAGFALRFLRPNMQFHEPFPWQLWLSFTAAIFAAACLMLAFHTWFSLRVPSFVFAVSLGSFAAIFALSLGMLEEGSPWHYFPWRWPINILSGLNGQTVEPQWVLLGLGGGLLFAILGGWDFTRRDVV